MNANSSLSIGLVLTVLACALFAWDGSERGRHPRHLGCLRFCEETGPPMATTSLNIVQRLGGPTVTTLCATFLGWRLGMAQSSASLSSAFTAASADYKLSCLLRP